MGINFDIETYHEAVKTLDSLNERLKKLIIERGNIYKNKIKEKGIFEMSIIDDNISSINAEIRFLERILNDAVIIGKHEDPNIIDIGDIIKANIIEDDNLASLLTFKLVSGLGNINRDIPEISLDSPIGQAVYRHKVGDICTYTVADNEMQVEILEKMQNRDQSILK